MADNMDHVRRDDNEERKSGTSWIGLIIRFIVAAIVLMITAYLTPGFKSMNFGTALLAALIISALDYLIQKIFRIDASPFGRGIVGFIVSALIIYLAQFVVPGMSITLFASIIAALIIGTYKKKDKK